MAAATATAPARDWCLGGVCLEVPERDLVRQYGVGRAFPPEGPFEHCYRARAKSTFLKATLDDEDPERPVTAVLASIEPACRDAGPARLGPDFTGCRGIRLFDSVDRLRDLGAVRRSPADKGYPWDGSPSDVSQFDYACEPDRTCSVRASAFVRGGTIIAISIWLPDC
jgi:hypothetical protein